MSSKKKDLNIMNHILAFLQSVFLVAGVGVVVFYLGFLAIGTIESNFDRSDYFNGLTTQIVTGAEDILIPTGFPITVLDDVIDHAHVRNDIRNHIRGEFSGDGYEINSELMARRLRDNLDAFLIQEGEEVSEGDMAGIVQELVTHYENHIQFPFVTQLARLVSIYRPLMLGASLGSTIFFLLTSAFIYRINHWKHRAFRYYAYGLGGGGLMLLGVPLAIRINGFYTRLAINPEYVYNFFITHIERGLGMFIIAGIICLALALGCAIKSTHQINKLR